jgi:LuxR family transcriptional regulator, maltose regulon positive regulatory protein
MPPTSLTIAGSEPALVRRPRLVNRLLESPATPLVLVVAAAGFGKTTLLSEWEERDGRPFAWIGLDDADNNAGRLATAIGHALSEIHPAHAVLVLDDFHVLHDPEALRGITALLDRLPAGSQLALSSRTEPALPTGRLRAHRKLLEIRSPELGMTHSEADALLSMAGVDLGSDQVETLVRRTEGWPAGLYLAALAIRDQPDADRALARFTGDDRLVADYFHDELLSQLPRDQLEFLLRTSVLDRLSGPLCDAVLERNDSGVALAALARSNLLLVPLDRNDEWYRYHSLLAGTLKAELRRLEPEHERELHRRASTWHSDHQDLDRAIAHAVAAHDIPRAGHLLWHNVTRYAHGGRNADVHRWLGDFTDAEVAAAPALALVAATAHLTSGDGNQLRHWASTAATGLARGPADGTAPGLEAGLALMRAALCADGLRGMRDDAARAYRLEREDSSWRSICCLIEGVARQLSGDRERARSVLEEGAQRGAVAAPAVQTLCLAQLALLALDDDDLVGAEALAGRARAQVERCGIGGCPTEASVFAVSALVRATRGRVADATRDLSHCRRLLAMLTDFVPWYEVEVRAGLARAALRLGEVRSARALLAEAARFLDRIPDAPVLAEWLAEASHQADALADSSAGDGWGLTTAELRVLQFLPSHLSFPEIAERLYVSPNTVKTHARAVYRKLDASSRGEAVTGARDAGLLDTLIAA